MREICALALLLAITGASYAQLFDVSGKPTGAVVGSFVCTPKAQTLLDVLFQKDGIRVNNVMIRPADGIMSGPQTIELTASLSNQGDAARYVSVEMLGVNESADAPFSFVISANPPFGSLSPGRADQIREQVIAPAFASTTTFCVRVQVMGDK